MRVKKILCVFIACLFLFNTSFIASAQNSLQKSSVYSPHVHKEKHEHSNECNHEEKHEHSNECNHEEKHEHSNECNHVEKHEHRNECNHEEKYEHNHECNHEHNEEALCDYQFALGKGVKIAVFDSGISDVDTEGSISFVEDEEILSNHGNTIAHSLKDMVPDAKLYDVRILNNKNEGTYSNLAKGVDWAVRNDIDIISLAMVGFETSEILEGAIKKAEENNILVVAAAGNESSNEPTYPAAYPTVISVGALDEDSEIAKYSNYGDFVDVYAYPSSGGTSYSIPFIVATAAQKIESHPNITAEDIRAQITDGKIKNIIEANNDEDGILYASACAHMFNGSYVTIKAATCTTSGTKVGKCTKCGTVLQTVTIPPLGHLYGSWTTTKSATCTTDGSRKRTCSRCYYVQTETITRYGHTFNGSYTTTKAATCTTSGTKIAKCTRCGAIIDTVTIPPLGHSYGAWTTIKTATCTTDGTEKRTCGRSGCSSYETRTLTRYGHTFNGSYTTTKDPTCTTSGTKVGKCTTCGTIVDTVTIPPLGHSYGSWTTTQAATCSTNGTERRTCGRSACSSYETRTISATGNHTFNGSYETIKAATCTTSGTKVGKCTQCGTILQTVTIPPLGHSFGTWTTIKSATCTTDGVKKRTCERSGCSEYETGTITSPGQHTFNGSYETIKYPTCTEHGEKVGKCTVCGEILHTVAIPFPGHSFGTWTTVVKETCTTTGVKKRMCSRSGCSYYETDTIDATGHTFNGSYETTKIATCTEEGEKVAKCNECGDTIQTVAIPKVPHDYGYWVTIVAPTCMTNGLERRICKNCPDYETRTITAPGKHTFNGSYETTKIATCTEEGEKVAKCTECGDIIQTVAIPKVPHDYGEWITIVASTCMTNGLERRTCKNCPDYETQTITSPGKHTFNGSYETTKDPTCTEAGEKVGYCTVCGEPASIVPIPPQHKYTESGITMIPANEIITGANTLGRAVKVTQKCSVCGDINDITIETSFSSSDSNVANVVDGYIKSGSVPGKCVITASYKEKTATCNVEHVKPFFITMTPATAKISLFNHKGPAVVVTNTTYEGGISYEVTDSCTFRSSDPGVAYVKDGYIMSGSKEGTCTITASYKGKETTCTVEVKLANFFISMASPSGPILGYNMKGSRATVTATYEGGMRYDVTSETKFTSDNPDVAYVENGYFKSGNVPGTCTITASYSGRTDTCKVEVKGLSIIIDPLSDEIRGFNKDGKSVVVKSVEPGGIITDVTTGVTFTSSKPEVASVVDGKIKSGNVEGECIITAYYRGCKASCKVKVIAPDSSYIEVFTNHSRVVSPGDEIMWWIEVFSEGQVYWGKTITVESPFELRSRQIGIDDQGKSSYLLKVPEDADLGSHTLRFSFDSCVSEETIYVSNNKTNIKGIVFDNETGLPLANATIKLGDKESITDENGNYSVDDVAKGEQNIIAAMEGYYDETKAEELGSGTKIVNFGLTKVGADTIPYIKEVSSLYSSSLEGDKYLYYGTDLDLKLTTDVDWRGHTEGYIKYITPQGTFKSTSGSYIFDISSFNGGDRIKVVAVSEDGIESEEVDAKIEVTPPITGLGQLILSPGFSLMYTGSGVLPANNVSMPKISNDIGMLDNASLGFTLGDYEYSIVVDNGKIDVCLGYDEELYSSHKKIKIAKFGGFDSDMNFEAGIEGKITFTYNSNSNTWKTSGWSSASVGGEYSITKYFWPPNLPVPLYLNGKFGAVGGYEAGITGWNASGPICEGSLSFNPYARVAAGAGICDVLSVEGWGKVDAEVNVPLLKPENWDWQWNIGLGYRVVYLIGEYEDEVLQWTIPEDKVSMQGFLVPELKDYKPLSRDYLNSGSIWAPRKDTMSMMSLVNPVNIQNSDIQLNVFPYSNQRLVKAGDKLFMVWVADNPERTDNNRTEIKYSVLGETGWTEPQSINDDGTADFNPYIASTSDSVFAVWENINTVMPEGSTVETGFLKEMYSKSDIKVAKYDMESGSFSDSVSFTSDEFIDRSARIAAQGDNAILLWVKNRYNNEFGSPQEPNEIMFSKWGGTEWVEPQTIFENISGIVRCTAAFDGIQGAFAYVVDSDGKLNTIDDHELYVAMYQDGVWGTPVKVTDNQVQDTNPQMIFEQGDLLLFWYQDGNLVCKRTIEQETADIVVSSEKSYGLADFRLVNDDNNTALVWGDGTDGGQDLFAAVYDRAHNTWSDRIQLTDDGMLNRSADAAYDKDGNLAVVYNRVNISEQVIDGIPQQVRGLTDLCFLTLKQGNDLSVDKESVYFSENNPMPGSTVDINAVVKNCGELAVNGIQVTFYNGDPLNGGLEIGGTTINSAVNAGSEVPVKVSWSIPEEYKTRNIYVVVNPEKIITERNYNNNQVAVSVIKQDPSIKGLNAQRAGDNKYFVTVEAMNKGFVPSQGLVVTLHEGSIDGPVIGTQTISSLEVLETTQLSFTWDISGKGFEDGMTQLFAVVESSEQTEEFSTGNNSYSILVNDLPLVSESGYDITGYIEPDVSYSSSVESVMKSGFRVELVGTDKYATTDEKGYFKISGVTADESGYTLRISKDCYLTREIKDVVVNQSVEISSQTTPLDMWAGDIAKDGAINMIDFMEITKVFNSYKGDGKYIDTYDLNKDNAINMIDIFVLTDHFNKTEKDY